MVKLVTAATGGRGLDAAAGAITGGLGGFLISAMCSGVLLTIPLAGRARDPSEAAWVMAITSGLIIVGGVGGFVGGAFLGALGSRALRSHGPEPGKV